jgi:hypothetical protein
VLIVAGFQVPVIAGIFVELAGNDGGAEFRQSGPICKKVGVKDEVTVMFIVMATAHCPEFGVNVYVELPTIPVLIVAGFHEPVMALFELPGREGAAEFWQSGPIWVNVGMIEGGITTIVKVVVEAHWPAVGVKV